MSAPTPEPATGRDMVEELAETLCNDQGGDYSFLRDQARDRYRRAARAALASNWLAARDARVAADAWDKGYETGRDDELFDQRGLPTDPDAHEFPHDNPYRQ